MARGLWKVQFDVYDGDDAPDCGLRIDVQSGLQVYRRYDLDAHSDVGEGRATIDYSKKTETNSFKNKCLENYQLVHVESSVQSASQRAVLEYAHYYQG